ncbi:unnamed protein product [Paramecium pentaurelia]|uniref:Transmembrane protein n=1 Tax=Paramecium pentaurelia TaxID=43138 RepID=A0A8S1XCU0_9CILI|nr:unnamed protein product [Paramecium pentaurelia]
MSLEKTCIIIFDEKEEIPLQIEIDDTNTKQYLIQPLTIDKVDLTRIISKHQQIQLQKKIDLMKKLLELNEQKLEQTMKITQNIGNFLPDFVFGPKQLQINEGQYEFYKNFCNEKKELQEKYISKKQINSDNQGSNVSILIYSGESYQDLTKQINYYNKVDIKINPIILINGKTAFKQLMKSKQELFLDFYQNQYHAFHQKFMTSNYHSLYFQIEGQNGYYFVFPQELNKLDLIKWIYQGILKFIQPKFAEIKSSNQTYLDNLNILQLFEILENEDMYFGIQCLKKIIYDGSLQYNFLGDFTDIALNLDNMYKIKQFHDPLSCIYKWEKIENFVDNYINRLMKEQFSNTWVVGYNSILPKLMFEDSNKELKIITKYISEQQFKQNQFETVFNQFCEINQNINHQLRKCRFSLSGNVFQWFISKVLFLNNYFAISVCFFFSFQCPYQVIYNFFGQSVGYTAIAVLLPIMYAVNVILFLLLTQLYHFKDKIIQKNQNQEIAIMGQKNNNQQCFDFKISVDSENVDVLYTQNQAQRYQINVEVQEDEYFKNATYSMNKELLTQSELYFLYQFPQLKYISFYVNILIEIQNYLDFGIFVFIFINIIFIHGEILLNQQTEFQIILIILAFLVLLYHLIMRRLGIFQSIFKFSLLSYFWQFLQLPKHSNSVIQKINQKKKLGTQLSINFILFYTFISIESYYNYSGYILIGILGYLSSIYLILGFFSIISKCCFTCNIPPKGETFEAILECELKFENDIQNTLIDKTRNLVARTNKVKNTKQDQMQFTQFIKNHTDITNLTDTIKIKIQENLHSQNLNKDDIDLISNKINEAVKKYFEEFGQQGQGITNQQQNQNKNQKNKKKQSTSNTNSKFKMVESVHSNQTSSVEQFLHSNQNIGALIKQNENSGSQFNQNDYNGSQLRQDVK